MKRLFGTDGIRGIAGKFPLDLATIHHIGMAVGESLNQSGKDWQVVLGRDTRESGGWISSGLGDALKASGADSIHDVGVVTTPGLAFLTRHYGFDLGIMISASHNPYQDNGIKIVSKDGFKLPDRWELEIEKRIYALKGTGPLDVKAHEPVRSSRSEEFLKSYVSFLTSQFAGTYRAGKIGLDVCNGSAHSVASTVFRELGAQVYVVHDRPDGKNINLRCGSLHIRSLVSLVNRLKLDLGVAFDGDADRSLFVTSSGRIFDGDCVLWALSCYLQERGMLKAKTVVGTVMTNFGLEKALNMRGVELMRAAVGDKYVLEAMTRLGANLGGEPSGHIILRDLHTTGDGILTAVKLAEVLSVTGSTLDELLEGYQPFPQVLEGLRVRERIPLQESPAIAGAIQRAEERLRGKGRLVVRYSGTEPLLRIMAEGQDPDQVKTLISQLKTELDAIFSSLTGTSDQKFFLL